MRQMNKETMLDHYLNNIKRDILKTLDQTNPKWTPKELKWYFRLKILKLLFMPVIDRRTDEYKKFMEGVNGNLS